MSWFSKGNICPWDIWECYCTMSICNCISSCCPQYTLLFIRFFTHRYRQRWECFSIHLPIWLWARKLYYSLVFFPYNLSSQEHRRVVLLSRTWMIMSAVTTDEPPMPRIFFLLWQVRCFAINRIILRMKENLSVSWIWFIIISQLLLQRDFF